MPGLVSSATSFLGSGFSQATSLAGSIGNVITSNGAGVVEYLTCKNFFLRDTSRECVLTYSTAEGGHAYTVVTSVGGEGYTLATSGAGVATSEFGSIYTVATAAVSSATSSHNAAVAAPSFSMTSSLLVGFATIISSTILGAVITL